jgi:diguanylate cyclase (GGDEF)-like protein/PAS domain S-box-containing protein
MPLEQLLDVSPESLPRWLWAAVTIVPDLVLLALVAWLWRSHLRTRRKPRQQFADELPAIESVSNERAVEREFARLLKVVAAERHRLRVTQEGMFDPLAIIEPVRDVERHIVDFTCLEANTAACNWLRVDRGRLAGSRLCDLFPEFESSGLLRKLAQLGDTGHPLVLDDFPFMLRGAGLRRLDVRGIRGDEWISLVWRDVTERHDAAEKLAASAEQFRLLAENSTDVIMRLDMNDTILWVSPSVTPVFGWKPAEVVGHDGREFLATAESREQYDREKARVAAGHGSVCRSQFRAADGDVRWIEVRSFPYGTSEGSSSDMVTSMHVIDEQVRMERDLEQRARIDSLTGLLNRRELLERLTAAVARRERPLGLLWCDIDGFKAINDAHGHAAGDAVLGALGERIRGCLRSADDMAGRISGDELIVALRGIDGLDEAVAIAENLRCRAAEPIPAGDDVIQATISIGVTLVRPGEGVDALLARADDAMYQAKERGKNRVVAAEVSAVDKAVDKAFVKAAS